MASTQTCANCGQPLDANDKFCRQCGLPTLRQAEAQKRIPTSPPDTGEMKRALDATPESPLVLRPFLRLEPELEPIEDETPEETTGSVVRVTSPTQATRMASTTLLMVVAIFILAVAGMVLLILALKS
jgi:hypothetical protein